MHARIDSYLRWLQEEEGYSSHTIAAYRNDLHQFSRWCLSKEGAGKAWSQIRSDDMTRYLFFLRDREYATSSLARKMAAVKSFFKHLVEREELLENPCEGISPPRVRKEVPQGLSREEIARLIAQPIELGGLKGLRDCAMLELMLATGLRVTEVVNLALGDVDLAAQTVRCGEGSMARILPLSADATRAVSQYVADGREALALADGEQTLFLNMRGSQLTRQGLWLIIKRYVRRAGISAEVTPHTLRHSFALQRLDDGLELSEVQELLGHANLSTTQVYAQAQEGRG